MGKPIHGATDWWKPLPCALNERERACTPTLRYRVPAFVEGARAPGDRESRALARKGDSFFRAPVC
jgi:hypothetical protein